jgi:hypothetical protein
MLDADLKLSLIEVNTNPTLEVSCPLQARIVPELLDNAFRIVLDPLFNPANVHYATQYREFQQNQEA